MFILLCVALVLSLLIATSMLLGSMHLLKIMMGHYQSLFRSLDRRVQDLTNLAASKDLETYRNLTAISQQMTETTTSAFSEANIVPMDDQAMAARLAEVYKQHGIDPSQAYDNPLDDFGPGAFM